MKRLFQALGVALLLAVLWADVILAFCFGRYP